MRVRIIATLLTLIALVLSSDATAAVVRVVPATQQINVGEQTTVDVRVENVSNFWGVQVRLRFNPTVLQVVDADPAVDGVQVEYGDFPPPVTGQTYVARRSADNKTGEVLYAATLIYGTAPLSGSGTICRITFIAIANGTSPLALDEVILVDSNTHAIPATSTSGHIQVGEAPPRFVYLPVVRVGYPPITPTYTPTRTPTATRTSTPTPSPTFTVGPSPTASETPTNTATPTPSLSPTSGPSPTPSETPTSTHTPTNTPTGTSTPTATVTLTPTPTGSPTPGGQQLVVNPGFEDYEAWQYRTTYPCASAYTAALSYRGMRSYRLGITDGPDGECWSSVWQDITIPITTTRGTISFWYYPISADTLPYDLQLVRILNTQNEFLENILRVCENTQSWTYYQTPPEWDITRYAGQTIRLYFGVKNDGVGGQPTAMYVDDVEMRVWGP